MDGGAAIGWKRDRCACREFHRKREIARFGAVAALLLVTCAVTSAHARVCRCANPPKRRRRLRVTRPFIDLFVSRALIYVGLLHAARLSSLLRRGGARSDDAGRCASRDRDFDRELSRSSGRSARRLRRGRATVSTSGLSQRSVRARFIVALALFIAAHGFAGRSAATLVAGLGWGVFLVADWAIACRVLPAGAMASAMGVWNLAIVLPADRRSRADDLGSPAHRR